MCTEHGQMANGRQQCGLYSNHCTVFAMDKPQRYNSLRWCKMCDTKRCAKIVTQWMDGRTDIERWRGDECWHDDEIGLLKTNPSGNKEKCHVFIGAKAYRKTKHELLALCHSSFIQKTSNTPSWWWQCRTLIALSWCKRTHYLLYILHSRQSNITIINFKKIM